MAAEIGVICASAQLENDCFIYYCCPECQGLFLSQSSCHLHRQTCNGDTSKSNCRYFACEISNHPKKWQTRPVKSGRKRSKQPINTENELEANTVEIIDQLLSVVNIDKTGSDVENTNTTTSIGYGLRRKAAVRCQEKLHKIIFSKDYSSNEPPDPFPTPNSDICRTIKQERSDSVKRNVSDVDENDTSNENKRKKSKSNQLCMEVVNSALLEEKNRKSKKEVPLSTGSASNWHSPRKRKVSESEHKSDDNDLIDKEEMINDENQQSGNCVDQCENAGEDDIYKSYIADNADVDKEEDEYKIRTSSVQKKTGSVKNNLKCSECDFSTTLRKRMKKHLNDAHGCTDTGVMDYKCELCDFRTPSNHTFYRHRNNHKKPFLCEVCSRRFATKHAMTRHKMSHTGEKPFKCKECDYCCVQRKSLIEHMRKHTGELLQCDLCDFKSCYRAAIDLHRQKHNPDKRFMCEECGYQTTDRGSFNSHTRNHLGVRNYTCTLCQYKALTKSELTRHMRSHTKEKVYFCDRCSYSTSYSGCLRMHMMSHEGVKPFHCALCGFSAIAKAKVRRHVEQKHKFTEPTEIEHVVLKSDIGIAMNAGDFRRKPNQTEEDRPLQQQGNADTEEDPPVKVEKHFFIQGTPLTSQVNTQLIERVINESGVAQELDVSVSDPSVLRLVGKDTEILCIQLDPQGAQEGANVVYECTECSYASQSIEAMQSHRVLEHADIATVTVTTG